MTRARVDREMAAADIDDKATLAYAEIAETCPLPTGDGSLPRWLAQARAVFAQLLDGNHS